MIRDYLLPLLTERFPGRFITSEPGDNPCAVFLPKHPGFGNVEIWDDGDEITLILGRFTHIHLERYDDRSLEAKEKETALAVVDYLENLFADRIALWGTHRSAGGARMIDRSRPNTRQRENEYVWSGPRPS